MSRIYFTTQHEGTAELRGSERAWMGGLCSRLAAATVPDDRDQLDPHLTSGSPLRRMINQPAFPRWVQTYLRGATSEAGFIDRDGTPLDSQSLVLNTALALGSDPVALMARLDGQCEIHCYVEGVWRSWLADLIEQGRRDRVMRAGEGWEDVVALLRVSQFHPVVCHYSVTDGFPNPSIAGWRPEDPADDESWDAWYGLPAGEQWERALAGLRGRGSAALELRPDLLRYPFGHSRSLLDLFQQQPWRTSA